MKKLLCTLLLVTGTCTVFAQLTTPPPGGNKKATVSELIGITNVTIHYDRPGVKGREGKIWGGLVHEGFIDQGFGSSKAAPWRAGANENTVIEFEGDVKIEGQPLPRGRYGLFIAYGPAESTVIFSKNSTAWGSYYYNEKEDALRVKVKPVTLDKSVEWLKFEFMNQSANAATIALQWEKLSIPFRVEADYINAQLTAFRQELQNREGFRWESWNEAAQWCLANNVNLEEALLWSDSATGSSFGGDGFFQPWSTKAQILEKLGRTAEADAIMKKALPKASMMETHQYGRSLLQGKRNREALEIFKLNYGKHPGEFTALMGLTRGYSANGDYKNALKYANMALKKAPDANNKNNVEAIIGKLKEGKDVNS
jgi:hypothetical protein